MNDAESQQASIPKDYGTIPVSADAGGSARRVVIALAAIALFASGVAVGSSIATTPRGASVVYSGQHGVWCNSDGQIVPCGGEVKFTPQMTPLSPPSRKTHHSHPNLAKLPPVDSINQWSYLDNGQISESGNIVAQGKKLTQLVAQDWCRQWQYCCSAVAQDTSWCRQWQYCCSWSNGVPSPMEKYITIRPD